MMKWFKIGITLIFIGTFGKYIYLYQVLDTIFSLFSFDCFSVLNYIFITLLLIEIKDGFTD